MSIQDLINKKLKRLQSVPDDFISGIDKVEKEYFTAIVGLLSQLETEEGKIIFSKKNEQILAEIESSARKLFVTEFYVSLVNDFISEFNVQAKLTDQYLFKALKLKAVPEIAAEILELKKKTTLDLLLSESNLDAAFINPLKAQVELAVTSQASFTDTLNNIQRIVTGDAEVDSKIMTYSKQVSYDSFAISDAAYSNALAEEIGAEWFKFSGDILPTSREFCRERYNNYYHKLEIEKWGEGEKTTGLKLPNSNGTWAGEIPGTNAQTIFSTRGGFMCNHFFLPVSIFTVPKSTIERAIAQGFYKPTDYEREQIGIS